MAGTANFYSKKGVFWLFKMGTTNMVIVRVMVSVCICLSIVKSLSTKDVQGAMSGLGMSEISLEFQEFLVFCLWHIGKDDNMLLPATVDPGEFIATQIFREDDLAKDWSFVLQDFTCSMFPRSLPERTVTLHSATQKMGVRHSRDRFVQCPGQRCETTPPTVLLIYTVEWAYRPVTILIPLCIGCAWLPTTCLPKCLLSSK